MHLGRNRHLHFLSKKQIWAIKRINNLWCFFDRPACYVGKREVKCSRSRFPRRKINAKIYIADELYEAVEKANPGDGKQEQYDIYQNLYFHPKLILSILEMWNTWSRVSWGGCTVPWTNIWGTWTTADTRWSSIQTSHFWGASIQYSARYCVYEPWCSSSDVKMGATYLDRYSGQTKQFRPGIVDSDGDFQWPLTFQQAVDRMPAHRRHSVHIRLLFRGCTCATWISSM